MHQKLTIFFITLSLGLTACQTRQRLHVADEDLNVLIECQDDVTGEAFEFTGRRVIEAYKWSDGHITGTIRLEDGSVYHYDTRNVTCERKDLSL